MLPDYKGDKGLHRCSYALTQRKRCCAVRCVFQQMHKLARFAFMRPRGEALAQRRMGFLRTGAQFAKPKCVERLAAFTAQNVGGIGKTATDVADVGFREERIRKEPEQCFLVHLQTPPFVG